MNDKFLEKKVSSWQVIDEILILMHDEMENRIKHGIYNKEHFKMYKKLKIENDDFRDKIIEWALSHGYYLSPVQIQL